tara:strand:+ start:393 stop:992 length:600 start_codon:yes stop_codon:yes gene_type:complete
VKSLQNVSKPIVIATGPPGSGKTAFPCQVAAEQFKSGDVKKIVLTRPIVCAGEDLGYLPGSIENKMDPWTRPMFDILENYFARTRIKQMVDNKTIEIAPLAYMRGRTFNDCFIIADEMQNSTQQQMKMVLSRLGEGSRMAVTGDTEQCDLLEPELSGLNHLIFKLDGYKEQLEYIEQIILGADDIQRHPVVKEVINVYL